MPETNGTVHPTPVTAWQLIGGVISIVAVMVVALWTVFKAITDNYVTNSRHDDLVSRLNREVQRASEDNSRLEATTRRLHDDNLSRPEFKAWQDERTKTIDRLIADQDKMSTKVEQTARDRASIDAIVALQRQIDDLSKRVEAIAVREDMRHIGGGISKDR